MAGNLVNMWKLKKKKRRKKGTIILDEDGGYAPPAVYSSVIENLIDKE